LECLELQRGIFYALDFSDVVGLCVGILFVDCLEVSRLGVGMQSLHVPHAFFQLRRFEPGVMLQVSILKK
jgi:hypothetical protein